MVKTGPQPASCTSGTANTSPRSCAAVFTRLFRGALVTAALAACNDSPSPSPATQPAPTTSLSADTLVFDGRQTGNFEIQTIAKSGGAVTALTNDSGFDSWWPRPSPDRTKILFYRTPAGTGDEYGLAALWIMDADGSNPHELIAQGANGWGIQGHAEWSPDGQQLVMCGVADATVHIFVTDANGQNPVRKTVDGGWNCDPAFSADGTQIVFNRCDTTAVCTEPQRRANLEIYLMPAAGGAIAGNQMTRLTNNALADFDAYFSPDGSTIAWLQLVDPGGWGGAGTWAVRAMNADGSNNRALLDDGFINSKPAWSLDGSTIYLHRLDGSTLNGNWGLFSIAPDGSDLQRIEPIVSAPLEFPSN